VSTVGRAAASVLAVGVTTAGLGCVVVPAAEAAPAPSTGLIGLSADGVSWGTSLSAPLFDPRVRWVPGDTRTAVFWVRNQAPSSGDVSVRFSPTVTLSGVDAQALRVRARAGDRAWTDVVGPAGQDLLDGDGLPAGQSTPVALQVQMRSDAPNTSMVLSTGLDLDVMVRDALASDGAADGPVVADGAAGQLPQTGSLLPAWAAPIAGGLVLTGAGLLLVAARRRRTDSDPRAVQTA